MMELIKGGFALSPSDEQLLYKQRSLTATINNNFIQVGAIYVNMSSKSPTSSDWFKRKYRDTNLQEWIDNPELQALNLGFNLQFGWTDVDIDSGNPDYNRGILAALKHIGVDTRFAFGRMSTGVPSHILVQLDEFNMQNYDELRIFAPKEFRMDGQRFMTELRSMGPPSEQIKTARQTVVPGSIYLHRTEAGSYDISVWYTSDGKIANKIEDIAETTPRKCTFAHLLTGIAYGTFLFVMRSHWIEGSRQNFAIKVAGWLARLITESRGLQESDANKSMYCPCDRIEAGEDLIDLACKEFNDPEAYMRKRTLRDALKKLENNPDAHIPGWPALESEIGAEGVIALRTAFMPGIDVSPLTKMGDTYLFDDSTNTFIDRDRHKRRINFEFEAGALERRHQNEFILIGGKSRPLWKVFETSPLRKRVSDKDLHPDLQPGAIVRMSPTGEVLADDDDSLGYTVFNTWSGWPIKPTTAPNAELMAKCRAMLNQLLGYLTQDNKSQSEWMLQWLAWIVQHPGQKQQIAPVIVGGQGVGKSFFGNIFLERMFENLWGSASPKVLEGSFTVEPFINKMIVFIDEAKFYGEAAIDEVKKLIRNDRIGGQEKYKSSTTHHIYSRLIFASNKTNMNLGQQNVQDRALFYIKSFDKDVLSMTDAQYRDWTLTLKPFFDEFGAMLNDTNVKEHFMYILCNTPTNRHALEDTTLSCSQDEHIIEANMSYPRRIAKRLIEEGRIWEDLDISAPFNKTEFEKRVMDICNQSGMKGTKAEFVFSELRDHGLIETITIGSGRYFRFKDKIGTLTDRYSSIIGVKLEARWEFGAEDFGPNDSDLEHAKPWRGRNTRFRNGI